MTDSYVARLPYWADSRAYYAPLRDLPWPVWLDSGYPMSGGGRYDIIAADPCVTIVQEAGDTVVRRGDDRVDPVSRGLFDCLRRELGDVRAPLADLPFCGGAIGFLGYDLARETGMLPARAGLSGWPTAAIGIYDWALIVDHSRRRSYFVRQEGIHDPGTIGSRRCAVCTRCARPPRRRPRSPGICSNRVCRPPTTPWGSSGYSATSVTATVTR